MLSALHLRVRVRVRVKTQMHSLCELVQVMLTASYLNWWAQRKSRCSSGLMLALALLHYCFWVQEKMRFLSELKMSLHLRVRVRVRVKT